MADVMPGTTSKGTPAPASAAASSPPRANTNGSPPLSRTTSSPRRPRSTSRALIPSWGRRTCPGALPTSMRSADAGARSSSDSCDSRSYTTTSARRRTSSARTVGSPGSPGRAPTRWTVTRPSAARAARSRPAQQPRAALLVEQGAGHGASHGGARRRGARDLVAHDRRAVRRGDQAPHPHAVPRQRGVGRGGQRAVAAQLGEKAALGVDRAAGRQVLDALDGEAGVAIVAAALDGERRLGDLGQDGVGVEPLVDAVAPAQAVERGGGHHHGGDAVLP